MKIAIFCTLGLLLATGIVWLNVAARKASNKMTEAEKAEEDRWSQANSL